MMMQYLVKLLPQYAMALALNFQEAHDIENTIITIKKVQSTYSPWNSKLHGLRQNPKY